MWAAMGLSVILLPPLPTSFVAVQRKEMDQIKANQWAQRKWDGNAPYKKKAGKRNCWSKTTEVIHQAAMLDPLVEWDKLAKWKDSDSWLDETFFLSCPADIQASASRCHAGWSPRCKAAEFDTHSFSPNKCHMHTKTPHSSSGKFRS